MTNHLYKHDKLVNHLFKHDKPLRHVLIYSDVILS